LIDQGSSETWCWIGASNYFPVIPSISHVDGIQKYLNSDENSLPRNCAAGGFSQPAFCLISKSGKRHMKRATEAGASLVEVLISLFIIAVGVIGTLGMHMNALRTTQQSVFHSSALHLAAEMADNMRANIRSMQVADGDNPYLNVDHQSGISANDESRVASQNCYDTRSHCDAQQLAQFDISEWLARLERSLPGARVRICRDAQPWNSAEQNFNWNCSIGSGNSASIVIKIGWKNKNEKDDAQSENAFSPSIALTVAPYAQ
jgi:type IV pilus assembly protein PilV